MNGHGYRVASRCVSDSDRTVLADSTTAAKGWAAAHLSDRACLTGIVFVLAGNGALLRVPVEASRATWNNSTPMKLLEGRYVTGGTLGLMYDVSPDGQRFLMIKAPGADVSAAPPALVVVRHWDEALKRLVPTK